MTNCEKLRADIAEARCNAIQSIITGDGMADFWQVRGLALIKKLQKTSVEVLEQNAEEDAEKIYKID